MSSRASRSLTLIELLISIVLIGLVILGLSSIELFCRNQLLSSDRRLKVQSEASFVLEHMAKHVFQAVNKPGIDAIVFPTTTLSFRVRVDANKNGIFDEAVGTDQYIAYKYVAAASVVQYCANMRLDEPLNADGSCLAPGWETLSTHVISDMSPPDISYVNTTNYLDVNITTCWDVDGNPVPCGGKDNPSVSMQGRCFLPSVSTR